MVAMPFLEDGWRDSYLFLQHKGGWAITVSAANCFPTNQRIILMRTIFAVFALAILAACQQKADAAKAGAPSAAAPAAAPTAVSAPSAAVPAGHMPVGSAPVDLTNISVPKASGPDARTVAEIITKRTELKNKAVVVRGKVVKVNSGILKMNWVHLRDGTGSDADGSNDLLVTTNEVVNVGDVVTMKGVVHIDKDLGMGYAYKVLVEEGKLQK